MPPSKTNTETCIAVSPECDITYVRCISREPFVMPLVDDADESKHSTATITTTTATTISNSHPKTNNDRNDKDNIAAEMNKKLNLNLGLPIDPAVNTRIVTFCRYLGRVLALVEDYGILLWLAIPLHIRHMLTMTLWKYYYPLHRLLLGRKTAIHPDASEEYHAISSLFYWGNLFPVSLKHIRLSINQVQVLFPPSHVLRRSMMGRKNTATPAKVQQSLMLPSPPPAPSDKMKVSKMEQINVHGTKTLMGYHIQLCESAPAEKVIFFIYGGAYLGGDCEGMLGMAESLGRECNADVFITHHRLLPEYEFEDALSDVCSSYDYLRHSFPYSAQSTQIFGVSSGGGLAVLLLQSLASKSQQHNNDDNTIMPSGAVLMCPFVDYTEPKGSFAHYYRHDLVVNRSVWEMGTPYFEAKLGCHENRVRASPLYRPMSNLPPLCVVVSEHECVYDQVIALVNAARLANVECTLGVWKYLCHVFPMLAPFVPEGKQAWKFMIEWMKENAEGVVER